MPPDPVTQNDDKTNAVEGLAVYCLKNMGGIATNALPFLADASLDKERTEHFRLLSFDAIFQIDPNSDQAARVLSVLLSDASNPFFTHALSKLYNGPPHQAATNFIPLLLTVLHTQSNIDHQMTIRALGVIGRNSSAAIQVLRAELESEVPAYRREAMQGLYSANALTQDEVVYIGKLLFDRDSTVRSTASGILRMLGKQALPALSSLKAARTSGDQAVAATATTTVQVLEEK